MLPSFCDATSGVFLSTFNCEIEMSDFKTSLGLGIGEPVISKLWAYTSLGYGPYSDENLNLILTQGVPTVAPQNLIATVSSSILLSWNSIANSIGTGFSPITGYWV